MTMVTKYQIAFIGKKHLFEKNIIDSVYAHLKELGVEDDHLVVIDENNFTTEYKANAPMFCLYFGDNSGDFQNIDLLDQLLADASLILPVADNLKMFKETIPSQLHAINGYELSSILDVEPLVGLILEGLGMLRISRRLFISYKRDESSTVAIQLYEQLEKKGFDVFLDTHSVRPGEPFQDELWHRLADTDIVVLLNTPGFLTSQWTREELAKANAMQIGILQLLWPSHKMEVTAALSIPFTLEEKDFGNGKFVDSKSYLIENTIKRVVEQAEFLRARSLAARQDNLITEFIKTAGKVGKPASLQPQKIIKTIKKSGDSIIIIPTVGVPQSFNYNKSEQLIDALMLAKKPEIYLLFDHINIRDNWLKHLDWLDNHLPIRTLRITNAEAWLQNI
jgi:hypothetical protein